MIKPGYRTSEFWFTLVSFVFSGLYLLGLLDNVNQKDDLIQETSKGVEAVILIIGQLTLLYKYISSRNAIKQTWWKTASTEEREEVKNKVINKRRKKDDTTRTTKARTRKSNPRSQKRT